MAKILTYLAVLVLKIKGIKKVFSQDPINYKKLRKEDQKTPPRKFHKKFELQEISIAQSKIFEIKQKSPHPSSMHVIYMPGGAFISGPAPHNWDSLYQLMQTTQASAWLVDYPKAPEANISQIADNVDKIYTSAIEKYNPSQLVLMGDSAGANLILSLVQRLLKENFPIPRHLILITPVFDSSLSNPEIDLIDQSDPMLSKTGLLSAKLMCANGMNLKDPMLSPIYGDFSGFPDSTLFLGGRDILYPDGKLAADKMKKAKVSLDIYYEKGMFHIYPLLPVISEGKIALAKISTIINSLSKPPL